MPALWICWSRRRRDDTGNSARWGDLGRWYNPESSNMGLYSRLSFVLFGCGAGNRSGSTYPALGGHHWLDVRRGDHDCRVFHQRLVSRRTLTFKTPPREHTTLRAAFHRKRTLTRQSARRSTENLAFPLCSVSNLCHTLPRSTRASRGTNAESLPRSYGSTN